MIRLMLAFSFVFSLSSWAAKTRFVNLSKDTLRIAEMYQVTGTPTDGNLYQTQAMHKQLGWHTNGWKTLKPGEGVEMNSTSYFLVETGRGQRVWFPNMEVSKGMLDSNRNNQHFDEFGSPSTYPNLQQRGFQTFDLQRPAGNAGGWYTYGNAYELKVSIHPFHFTGLDRKTARETYHMPGPVVGLDIRTSQTFGIHSEMWFKNANQASCQIDMEGKRGGPFEGRREAKYIGNAVVTFSVPRGNGVIFTGDVRPGPQAVNFPDLNQAGGNPAGNPLNLAPGPVNGGVGKVRYVNNISMDLRFELFHPAAPGSVFQQDVVRTNSTKDIVRPDTNQPFNIGGDWHVRIVSPANGTGSDPRRLDRIARQAQDGTWVIEASRVASGQ